MLDWSYYYKKNKVEIYSDTINEEIVTITDKLLEYNWISTKEHTIFTNKCLN